MLVQDASSTYLYQQLQRRPDWLMGVNYPDFLNRVEQRLAELLAELAARSTQPTILLAEADPAAFLAGFLTATAARCPVVLGNPTWTETEWRQIAFQVRADLVWGELIPDLPQPSTHPLSPGWILIPTGGSSGQLRFAVHTWETLTAAVAGFQAYFQVEQIHSCCLLPLHHVSGLMQVVRSWQTGGRLAVLPFKSVVQSELKRDRFDPAQFFLSLVPTQLQKLLQSPVQTDWLRQFHTVFLGGAPAWDSLLAAARQHQIRLAPTYGMTETAAQIATLKPEAFLRGETSCGPLLPHATIEILPLPEQDDQSPIGQIRIQAKSLMLGYFPPFPHLPISLSPHLLTDDLGYLDNRGHLHIIGRSSGKIITGGENVFPTEIEAAIRNTGLVSDVCVVGLPDPTWGEAVVAVCVAARPGVTDSKIQAAIAPHLSRYKQPKRWVWVEQIPRSAQGKLNLSQLKQFLESGQTHTRPRRPAESSAGAVPETPPNWQ